MPTLAWGEIRNRATQFAGKWAGEKSEAGEYQSFWNDFFDVFGLQRRSVAVYQKAVSKLTGHTGHIDLFWQGVLLAEHKSKGQNLDAAFTQATDYFTRLEEDEKPRYIIVTDYNRMRLYDLEGERGAEDFLEFALSDFPEHLRAFAFMRPGYREYQYKDEDPVNRRAVKAIGKLHDALVASNYPREATEKLLTRLVFCFFGDDTDAWEPDTIHAYLEERSNPDGSDIGDKVMSVFRVLNQAPQDRQTTTDEMLLTLPHVNGGLFLEQLPALFGSQEIRDTLLECASFNWSSVSPAIFGSMFQQVMSPEERHDIGAHYTSEENILKVIRPLFLDELQAELDEAGAVKDKLESLWEKLARITLLDPACGCGNFLVIAYRELRKLELEVIRRTHRSDIAKAQEALALPFDPKTISRMSVERMHGIELETFPAEIARLSLWLTDHIANVELGALFGKPEAKFPLADAPHILGGTNALTADWEAVVPKSRLTHILGNPPFLGHHLQSPEQKAELEAALHNLSTVGVMDYVSGWYVKASEYIQGTRVVSAFVSTNSISQGEQVGILWGELLLPLGISIHFAHRTFRWTNEAPGKAAVYCVIIGFAAFPAPKPRLFDYAEVAGEPHEVAVSRINPYLVDAPDTIVRNRTKPLMDVPPMKYGNKPSDGGALIMDDEEKVRFLQEEPGAEKFIRRYIGADDFLKGGKRWCLWLVDADPAELRKLPALMRRVEAVRIFRENSKAATTRAYPYHTLFRQITQPEEDYILVPGHSSERRQYVPFGFFSKEVILSNASFAIAGATLYHFGVLESEMHMAWMRAVCGRLKSDYRYSKDIVYNNFPWPETDEQKAEVEQAAQAVLDARAAHPDATLADLYDPDAMPKNLRDAHSALDRAVDKAYGAPKFASEAERLQYLFAKYQELTENQ